MSADTFSDIVLVYAPFFSVGFFVGGMYAAYWSHKDVQRLREELTQPKKTSASA